MGILNQQIVISDLYISNQITTDPGARSLTMRNGYYANWKYPDNRSHMTGQNPLTPSNEAPFNGVLENIREPTDSAERTRRRVDDWPQVADPTNPLSEIQSAAQSDTSP